MKIITSFMDDIIINPGEYHSITFESSYIQQIFRILLSNYFSNKRKSERIDGHYIKIVSKTTGNTLQRKDIYFINFDCNVIALKTEKSTNKLLQDLLFYHLENNATLLENFIQLNEEITRFTSAISLEDKDRKSTRLNSSHVASSYAVFCLKKKTTTEGPATRAAQSLAPAAGTQTGPRVVADDVDHEPGDRRPDAHWGKQHEHGRAHD